MTLRWLRQHLILTLAVSAAAALAIAGAARVSGLAQVRIEEHQPVKSRQALAQLDAAVRAQIRAAEQIVSHDEHLLGLVRAACEAGAVSEMDVLSAQSQLDHDRMNIRPPADFRRNKDRSPALQR
jgi:hypothetical protein